MTDSRQKYPQKNKYRHRADGYGENGDTSESVFSDKSYYRDIEQIADLDVYHFGNIEKKAGNEDFRDLNTEDEKLQDLDGLEQRIILAGLEAIESDIDLDEYESYETETGEPSGELNGTEEIVLPQRTAEEIFLDIDQEEDLVAADSAAAPEEADDRSDATGEDTACVNTYRWNPDSLLIDVSMCEEINFVMQIGGVLLVRDISLKNEDDGEIRDIKVAVSSDEEIIFPCQETAPTLYAGEEWHIVKPDIRVNTSFLAFLRERKECVLTFEVSGKDRFSNLISKTIRKTVTVMAYDQWKGNDFHTELLPAFIMPNQPFISELVMDTAEILGKETGNPVFDGYLTDDSGRIRQMASAAYRAVTRYRIFEIPYAAGKSDLPRRIRFADKVRKQSRAAAYDITFIYLSCLEAMGLNPVIYLRKDESYAGVWMRDKTFDNSVLTDEEASPAIEAGEIIFIDCATMLLGKECPFEESALLAEESVQKPGDFAAVVDVIRARREGVKALPIRIHSDFVPKPVNAVPESAETGKKSPLSVSAARNVEEWKKKLYDPDKSDRLTNLKIRGKKQSDILPLLSASVNDFAGMLSDVMYFGIVSCPEEYEKPEIITPENYNQVDSIRDILRSDFRRKKIHSIYGRQETIRRVRRLTAAAEDELEKRGKSVLYLAAGLLKWTEITTGKARYAPLVLLPVEVRSGNDKGRPFRLSEAQPQLNYALLSKMERDCFLKVEGLYPLPRDFHGVDVKRVCELFRTAIDGRDGWAVYESALLGIFDLPGFYQSRTVPDPDTFRNHHILRGLTEGMNRTEIEKSAVGEETVFLPLRADRFQEYAVKAATREMSFVISGAPGTGKTETIVNIIANAIYRRKTVLLACEKTQVYRDVLKQMEKIGLAPLCLYEQQGNVRLRELLSHLQQAMRAGSAFDNIRYRETEYEVNEIGQALDGYSETMNSRHVCGYSLRELLDLYEEYSDYPEFDMQGIDADNVTSVILKQRKNLVRRLVETGRSIGHPKDNPLSCVKRASHSEELQEDADRIAADGSAALGNFRELLQGFVDLLELEFPVTEESISKMVLIAQFVSELRDVPSFLLLKHDAEPVLRQLREYISGADAFAGKDLDMGGRWDREFLHADMESWLTEYDAARSKVFFRDRAVKEYRSVLEQYAKFDFEDAEIPALLSEVKEYQEEAERQTKRWEELTEEGRYLLREYPSYDEAVELSKRMDAYRQICDQLPTVTRYAYNADIRHTATELADALPGAYEEVKADWEELVSLLEIDTEDYSADPIGRMDCVYRVLLDNRDHLQNWIKFNDLKIRAGSNGLQYLVDRYLDGSGHEEIMGIYYRGTYAALIRSVLGRYPAAGKFDAEAFNALITRFKDADSNLTRLSSLMIQDKAARDRPRPQESPKIAVELLALRRAFTTFGRGMTAGSVFEQMPNVLVRLCPCIMMSPAACAEYITDNWPSFDIVIMDEASSVPVESAVGVIARGKELILAGDVCQNAVPENIMECCLEAGLPEIKLGTHYRSMDERLFRFSNREFYNGAYIAFPAPDRNIKRIEYIDVPEGSYDRKTNVNEAEAGTVVREILRQYAEAGESTCSIGVIAFGYHQRLRIAELLDDECVKDKLFAEWLYASEEKILVTDSMSAQGYERDSVILSVTMSAGRDCPETDHLLDDNGWKYLNTAITRARERVTVISSVTAEEIRAVMPRSRGAMTLADYLDYASGNRDESHDSISVKRQKRAGVLKSIRKVLEGAGYVTKSMIGESEYRVDIGVALPEDKDRFILGIMLDSENYSGIGAARDRDILMTSELLRRGWPVMNVWCMEWWTNREDVKKRILEAAEYMRQHFFVS